MILERNSVEQSSVAGPHRRDAQRAEAAQRNPEPFTNVDDAVMTAEERQALPDSDFAVPLKRKLPIHDRKHAKLAWSMVSRTKGLTAAERKTARRRILARLKRLGVDLTNYYKGPVNDETDADHEGVTLALPEDLSLCEFHEMLQEELRESFPGAWVCHVYPGYVVARLNTYAAGEYDDQLYRIGYRLVNHDDHDGDGDEVHIEFDLDGKEPVRMVPKIIEDSWDPGIEALDGDFSGPGGLLILSDAAELAADRPLRFRLPGPVANKVNGNRRFYPRAVLHDAIVRAQAMIREGRMLSYSPHPKPAQAADGSPRFITDYSNRVAKIDGWFLDDKGQSWIDRTIIRTRKGREVEASIKAKAAVATSMRAVGKTSRAVLDGREVTMATYLELYGDDFVENPATDSTWARAQVLSDEQVITLLQTSTPDVALQLSPENPEILPARPATKLEDSATMGEKLQKSISTPPEPAEIKAGAGGNRQQINAAGTEVENRAAEAGHISPATRAAAAHNAGEAKSGSTVVLDDTTIKWLQEKKADDERKRQQSVVDRWLLDACDGKEAAIGDVRKTYDLSRFGQKEIEAILDNVRGATVDTVVDRFERAIALMDRALVGNNLRSMGYMLATGGKGQTVKGDGQIIVTDEARPWMPHAMKICEAMDAFGRRSASTSYFRSEAHMKFAQPFVDSLISDTMKYHHGQAQGLLDSSEHFLDDVGTTSLANLMQQPTVTPATVALIYQVFWTLRWLSMVDGIGPEGFNGGPGEDSRFGENLRIAVEGRSDGRPNLVVGENMPIQNYTTQLNWLNFSSIWRKLGFTLSKEAEVQLARGSARYDAIGRQMYSIAMMISENIDLALANEAINASDEYQPVVITNEAHSSGAVITGSPLTALGYGPGVVAAVRTSSTTTVTGPGGFSQTIQIPLVPPRHQRVIVEGQVTSTIQDFISNPITCVVNGTTLVQGILDPVTSSIIDDPQGPAANSGTSQYAVDYENGVFVFAAGTTVDTNGCTISYSYATNIDYYPLGASTSAADLAIFYDGLLRQLDESSAIMASSPRYRGPNMAVMDYRTAVYFTAARQASQLYQPVGTEVGVTALSPNRFGKRGEVELEKVNTPWRPGQTRILLTSNRATKYGIQYPFTVEGPIPNYSGLVQGGKVLMQALASKIYWASQNSVICTPVGFELVSGQPSYFNHPNRTIKLVGTGSI